jgi:hypothetical protein
MLANLPSDPLWMSVQIGRRNPVGLQFDNELISGGISFVDFDGSPTRIVAQRLEPAIVVAVFEGLPHDSGDGLSFLLIGLLAPYPIPTHTHAPPPRIFLAHAGQSSTGPQSQ